MRVLVWITEGGWEACVDAAAELDADDFTLLHVASLDLPGPRGRRHEQVLARMSELAGEAASALLDDAEERLGRDARKVAADGFAEEIVMEAAADADLLVLARDSSAPGPHSIGHAARFVVDHAPCALLLVWPEGEPDRPAPKPKPKPKGKPKPKPKPPPYEEW
ncbi:MAG TPA: universal stress protein [Solirubrobacter sp.]|nr:universal stress protein [Solirubrobacter sp.]